MENDNKIFRALEGINLDNLDWKELFNLCLDLIKKHNKKLTFKQLINEYEGYFDFLKWDYKKEDYVFKNGFLLDDENNKISKKEFLDMCMKEEENYKVDYSKEELKDCCLGFY